MPLDKTLKKVLLIGSGPIVIGQAAEFDYAGTQACRVLGALGLETVLVNSNPATIMTDSAVADKIYIEPLNEAVLRRIIQKERPDGLLSTIGGQMGLTLSMQLAKSGFLDEMGVRLLGASLETIENAEDRLKFKEQMDRISQPTVPSGIVTELPAALELAEKIGYPVIIRPAFTLGGSGGGIAQDETALREIARTGLEASPIGQILVEKCISGWKEIEFEVVRDSAGNALCVCSMENFDPVGVHTGDSIVAAPALTLADPEYQMLRTAAIEIIQSLGVCGGCNVQFALHPERMEYAVIEVNPRVSRSSALASKATGYPIAKVAAQLAVGLRLDEIPNDITGKTTAFFEPALDYVVVKFPKWPFDKFYAASRELGTQMKATGEVMAIAPTFEQALMKAVRGAEIKLDTLALPAARELGEEALRKALSTPTDERLFAVYEALRRGMTVEELHTLTLIDEWFLARLVLLVEMEKALCTQPLDEALYRRAKKLGYPDSAIARLSGQRLPPHNPARYRMVDTCAAEFAAQTPYFYGVPEGEDEASGFIGWDPAKKRRTVVVLGSGPIRIGQGIEFDYASVHCVRTLKELGYEVVMINNNPETVSTDFDTADRLYFEPLTPEDVLDVIDREKPCGAVVMFGGQTAINLAETLEKHGIPILGSPLSAIDAAEDREKFDAILGRLGIARPQGRIVRTKAEALAAAEELGYPVLVRPSYVLGGKNMMIAYADTEIEQYMEFILAQSGDNTVLVDKYLSGREVEVDAICDGEEILIPGIMEHVERAGVHSGDSIAVYPAWNLGGPVTETIVDSTRRLALALGVRGLINIQYVIHNNRLYVIEANPRASRTVPYISKVTGLPIAAAATRVMMGQKLSELGYGSGLFHKSVLFAAKAPAFSFEKLSGVDSHLGPEMKSTGEVLGIGRNIEEALYKALVSAGYRVVSSGGLLVTMQRRDSYETLCVARGMAELGFAVYAPAQAAEVLRAAGVPCQTVEVGADGDEQRALAALVESGAVQYVLATGEKGDLPDAETIALRRRAIECRVACLTSIDTANALLSVIRSGYSCDNIELFDAAHLPTEKKRYRFVKMRASENDYIYFDCFEQRVENPESLSVWLSSRRRSIGGDGVVLILPSEQCDAGMRMYNSDGTPAEIAANAMRCVAKYLYERGRVPRQEMTIETEAGPRSLRCYVRDGRVYSVSIEMRAPDFTAANVPLSPDFETTRAVDKPYTVDGVDYRVTCLSMGNPHCVIFVDDVDAFPVGTVGPRLETDPAFPQRANISFATVLDRWTIKMRVWERGIGETWSCGTGACAAAAAATELGLCEMNAELTLHLRGGDLTVNRRPDGLTLTGDAQIDFEGEIEI